MNGQAAAFFQHSPTGELAAEWLSDGVSAPLAA
jgi:hypothetical protein